MNYQGIAVDALTPRLYSTSNFEDLDLLIKHIKTRYPQHLIFAVGTPIGKLSDFI
jgi:hypothetical protein